MPSRRHTIRLALLGLAMFAIGAGEPASARLRAMRPIFPTASAVTWEQYAYELRNGQTIAAQLGTMSVPNRRRGGHGATLDLRFVRLPAIGESTGAPIIYLAGGPGSSGIDAGRGDRWPLFELLRRHGDVILLDQRGVGMSSPPPACSTPWTFPNDVASTEASFNASLEAAASVCAREWHAAGVDLAGYNTADNAADVADLARALGGRVRLVGVSYGTFLALAMMRDHDALVERVVLAGAEGPDHTLKLPLQADLTLDGLSRRFAETGVAPDLGGSLRRVLAGLERHPVWAEAPTQDGPVRVLISRYDVQLVVTFFMATSANAARLPTLITSMESGDYSGMAQSVLFMRRFYAQLPAMPLAMDAASPVSPGRAERAAEQAGQSLFTNAINAPSADFATALGVAQLGRRWRSPVRTSVPALFISGELDSRTPPANAEDVRRGFRSSAHIVVEGGGHDNDLFFFHPRILERIDSFMSGRTPNDEVLR